MKLAYAAALVGSLVGFGFTAATAHAAYTLVDNFGTYAPGADLSLGGVGGWATGGGDGAVPGHAIVVAAPGAPGGATQALQLSDTGGNTTAYLNGPLTIPVGPTPATLFYSVFASSQASQPSPAAGEGALGMTDSPAPGQFGDGRGWVMLGNDGDAAGASAAAGNIGVGVFSNTADNTGTWDWPKDTLATQGTWYNIWEVYHNDGSGITGGTYDVYIQGGEFPTQTLLESGVFYRGNLPNPSGALTTLALISDDPAPTLFTNMYFDATNDSHLVNPAASGVPEPASLAVMGLGLAGLIARRRK